MAQRKADTMSLDIMNIDTMDMTFSKPTSQKQPAIPRPMKNVSKSVPKTKNLIMQQLSPRPTSAQIADVELTGPMKQGQEENPWWHMGTTQYHNDLKKEDPNDFSWALRTGKVEGGLDFGLNISGSTMPFTGRKRVFY